MKSIALAIFLILPGPLVCGGQGKPAGDCFFPDGGFATTPEQKVQIAEVAARDAVQMEECGSEKGCILSPPALGTPVLIYRGQGEWTCGYFSGREGAGPAWIRSDALRAVPRAHSFPDSRKRTVFMALLIAAALSVMFYPVWLALGPR